ncbi:hypothetical protein [Paramicrobacterium agarici]|uniref:hypothetical protein n=1 Tax=Paramicrobacterium agarici TaxID=630514 RepID=UPI00115122ED|nr:hypothetical protein [Microbacterium agarici]TQO23046.1 hypothetical protein FB385_1890 [Microbacterium agarici]
MGERFWRFYELMNRGIRTFTGPAQIGAGYAEGPDVRPADPACPMCSELMSLHTIRRSNDQYHATRVLCPR